MMSDMISILGKKAWSNNEGGISLPSEHQQREIHKQGAQRVLLMDRDISLLPSFLEIDLMGSLL